MVLLILAFFPANLGKDLLSWPSSVSGIAWDCPMVTSCEGPGSDWRGTGVEGSDGGMVLPRSAAQGLNTILRRAPSPFEEELVKREIEGSQPLRGEDFGIRDDVVSPAMALSRVEEDQRRFRRDLKAKNQPSANSATKRDL